MMQTSRFILSSVFLMGSFMLFGVQEEVTLKPVKDPLKLERHYFPEVDESSVVYEIYEEDLYFSFHEPYKSSENRTLKLLGPKKEEMYTIKISVEFGINFYHLDLSQLTKEPTETPFKYNHKYQLSYGRKKLIFVPIDISDKPLPLPGITVHPIAVDCEGTGTGNLIEYYGSVTSGNAPYKVNWFVFADESRETLLYKPVEQYMRFEGEVGTIVVDENFDYTVVLAVLDACDKYAEEIYNVTCIADDSDGVNIYIENHNIYLGGGNSLPE